jgi:hypothetical protein
VLATGIRACARRPRLFARLVDVGLADGAFPVWAWPFVLRGLRALAA